MKKRHLWLVALLVLIAACNQEPTEQALETPELREYAPEAPGQFGAAINPAIVAPPGVTLPSLDLAIPSCRETPAQTLVCVGWIENQTETPYRDVQVTIELLDADSRVISTQSAFIARDWIPGQERSPYRVIFPEIPGVSITPRLSFSGAEEITASSLLSMLDVRNVQMESPAGNQFQITGEVHNQTENRIDPVRVVVTLLDSSGGVAGFRTLELEALAAGQTTSFETIITSDLPGVDGVEVSADGYRR